MDAHILEQGSWPVTSRNSRKRGPRGVARRQNGHPGNSTSKHEVEGEIGRLTRELEEARTRLRDIEEEGTEAYTARKIETLMEAGQVARGHAFDASLARNRAESDLRKLERAILEARGPFGWLLRRAARRVLGRAAISPG